MKETEIKSIIDNDAYERIKKAFKWDAVTEQTNHYYTDRNGILCEKRITVRIRVIEGNAKIQVKHHKNKDSALQISEENEYPVSEIPEVIDSETAERITGINTGELYRMGAADTLRYTFERSGSELCLDKTTYFNTVDYEVEVEYEGKMSADLLMKLTSLGVVFNKSCVGKFARFLDEYKKNKD